MTADELKAAIAELEERDGVRISDNTFAKAVCASDGRTVRRWKSGERDVPGPVTVLLSIWRHPKCPSWAKPWLDK